jgi:hypothetical protein
MSPFFVHVRTDATNDGANTFVGRGRKSGVQFLQHPEDEVWPTRVVLVLLG